MTNSIYLINLNYFFEFPENQQEDEDSAVERVVD